MRKLLAVGVGLVLLAAIILWCWISPEGDWKGVDEAVVERVAREAGRPPADPVLNTERGDLLLFLFLIAGAMGGFVIGYRVRELFPPGGARPGGPSHD